MSNNDDNNRANQLNPSSGTYWNARGVSETPPNWKDFVEPPRPIDNNRANQLNPASSTYWGSRGISPRPSNWEEVAGIGNPNDNTRANRNNPNHPSFLQSSQILADDTSAIVTGEKQEGGMSWLKMGLIGVGAFVAGAAVFGASADTRTRRNRDNEENRE